MEEPAQGGWTPPRDGCDWERYALTAAARRLGGPGGSGLVHEANLFADLGGPVFQQVRRGTKLAVAQHGAYFLQGGFRIRRRLAGVGEFPCGDVVGLRGSEPHPQLLQGGRRGGSSTLALAAGPCLLVGGFLRGRLRALARVDGE